MQVALPEQRNRLESAGFEIVAPPLPGQQFSEEELSDDKVTCSLRYAAEVLFSRCTDENILTDVVPRNAFSHFHHSIHWAHANANLGGEFESRN
jgi:hypothetical protein